MGEISANEVEQSRKKIPWLLRVTILAAGYYALGELGSLITVSTAYASPFWPAAGLALACMLLCGAGVAPGVFIGSFLVNMDGQQDAVTLHSAGIALGIALGATVQAVVGAQLVRRFVGVPTPLDSPGDITKFLLLGGLLSCLISATFGNVLLGTAGLIYQGEALASWLTWWVGDSLGVLVMTPLLMIPFAEPRPVWRARRFSLGVPMLAAFAGALLLTLYSSTSEKRRLQLEFESECAEMTDAIDRDLGGVLEILQSIRSFFDSSIEVDQTEFDTFVTPSLSRHPGIQALEFVPRVGDTERPALEEAMRKGRSKNFQILERDPKNEPIPAATRPEYFPVIYVEPFVGNEDALGYDLASSEERRDALLLARETGQPVSTIPLTLVQEKGEQVGVLIFLPILKKEGAPPPSNPPTVPQEGFAVAVVRTGDIVESALAGVNTEHIQFRVTDKEARDKPLLYDFNVPSVQTVPGDSETAGEDSSGPGAFAPEVESSFRLLKEIEFASRTWELEFLPRREFFSEHRSWWTWWVLVSGLLFTGLLGAFLLLVTGHTAHIQALVRERTRELDTQTKLAVRETIEATAARDRAEQAELALRGKTMELERSNKDLEQFAYVASHDLQEPLRMVASYMQLLEQRYKDKLDSDATEFIDFAVDGAKRMQQLIKDLLNYSRVTTRGKKFATVDCEEIVSQAVANLTMAIDESGAQITRDPLPKVEGDENQLLSLFQNLISNAIKYRGSEAPRIRLSSETNDGEHLFSVQDNGIGIDPKNAERIFAIFQRLHARTEYSGTGIGLAICNKIVERHGGRIWVEEAPEGGSIFKFTLPTPAGAEATAPDETTSGPGEKSDRPVSKP